MCCSKQISDNNDNYHDESYSTDHNGLPYESSWLSNDPNGQVNIKKPGEWIKAFVDSKQAATLCGAGPAKLLSIDEQRVVGGTDAVENSWPGMVNS